GEGESRGAARDVLVRRGDMGAGNEDARLLAASTHLRLVYHGLDTLEGSGVEAKHAVERGPVAGEEQRVAVVGGEDRRRRRESPGEASKGFHEPIALNQGLRRYPQRLGIREGP